MTEIEQTPGKRETGANSDDVAMSDRTFLAQIVNQDGVAQGIKDLFAKALQAEDGNEKIKKGLARFLADEDFSISEDGEFATSLEGTKNTVPKMIMVIAARAALKSTMQ